MKLLCSNHSSTMTSSYVDSCCTLPDIIMVFWQKTKLETKHSWKESEYWICSKLVSAAPKSLNKYMNNCRLRLYLKAATTTTTQKEIRQWQAGFALLHSLNIIIRPMHWKEDAQRQWHLEFNASANKDLIWLIRLLLRLREQSYMLEIMWVYQTPCTNKNDKGVSCPTLTSSQES